MQTARRVGTLRRHRRSRTPRPRDAAIRGALASAARSPAADLSPDGRTLAVLTYDRLLLYPRAPGEAWAQRRRAPPASQPLPWLPQAEAHRLAARRQAA